MSRQVIHGTDIYDSVAEASRALGVRVRDVHVALKSVGAIKGKRIAYYTEPDERPGLVSAERSSGPLIKHPITHGIGILRR